MNTWPRRGISCSATRRRPAETADAFNGSVLATEVLANVPRAGRTLAELQVARATGVRIVGIQRAGERIINPDGKQTLEAGDNLLVAGTPSCTRSVAG